MSVLRVIAINDKVKAHDKFIGQFDKLLDLSREVIIVEAQCHNAEDLVLLENSIERLLDEYRGRPSSTPKEPLLNLLESHGAVNDAKLRSWVTKFCALMVSPQGRMRVLGPSEFAEIAVQELLRSKLLPNQMYQRRQRDIAERVVGLRVGRLRPK